MEKDDKQKEWLKSLLSLSKEELETLSKSEIDIAKSNLINLINSNLDVLIIKGAAGTGKTKTIEVLNEIKDTYKINYKIFTPTFAAATNIRSRNLGEVQTIQWFFNKNLKEQKQLLYGVDILIFDEASMLTSGYLEDLINLRKFLIEILNIYFWVTLLKSDLMMVLKKAKSTKVMHYLRLLLVR